MTLTRHSESFCKCRALQPLIAFFALSSVVKLFSGQGPPPAGDQDLTVVLASRVCSRETTPGHKQVCVRHRI